MTKQYIYSVLKYRPSYFLDEQVNIGLLFVFPTDNSVRFLAPKDLTRINYLYPNSNLLTITRYLEAFEDESKKLNAISFFQERETFINKFLPKDANSLFFSDFKEGEYSSIDKTLAYYNFEYFKFYGIDKRSINKY